MSPTVNTITSHYPPAAWILSQLLARKLALLMAELRILAMVVSFGAAADSVIIKGRQVLEVSIWPHVAPGICQCLFWWLAGLGPHNRPAGLVGWKKVRTAMAKFTTAPRHRPDMQRGGKGT